MLAKVRGCVPRAKSPPQLGRQAPLIHHVIDTARQLGAANIHVVVGHDADAVESAVSANDVSCHRQAEQLGTGHAVKQAIPACRPESTVIVLPATSRC